MINQIIAFDELVAAMIAGSENLLVRMLSVSAYFVVITICLYYTYHYFKFRKHKKLAFWIPAASIILFALIEILKRIVERVRPNGELLSFPSRHVALAFFIAFMLPVEKKWKVVLFIWASLVGLSRLILAEHWLSDVITGVGIGLVAGYLIKKKITSS